MTHFFAPDRCETPEFTVRCYQPGDGRMLQEAANASYEHLRTFMLWAKPEFTWEEQEARVRRFCGLYLTNEDFVLGIFTPDNTRLMGGTGYHLRGHSLDDETAEIGMWISAQDAGKGLGTRVLKALLHWGFTAWPWQRIEWKCDTRNIASASVARKAGMQLEATFRQDVPLPDGTRRDTHLFSMLRDEYTGSQSR
ncbi:MAG: GNAT family N-acetyltransferase [Anaerolineae bacterium]|nr:GNAT family N-acetyltransferase [Anaerolineae bacterium]